MEDELIGTRDAKARQRDLAIVLYHMSARRKPHPIDETLVDDELRRLRGSRVWEGEKRRILNTIEWCLDQQDFPFEETLDFLVFSRADLAEFLRLVIGRERR